MSQQIGKAVPKYSALRQRTQQEQNLIRSPPSHKSQQYVACDEPHQPNSIAHCQPFLKSSLKYSNSEQKKEEKPQNSILLDIR